MRYSAELRRFSSPHPSLFSEFLGSNDKGMAARAYIGGGDPVAPEVVDRPLSPVGWATCPFFCQGPRCEFEEKKLQLGPVVLGGRPGGIFEIFQNRHIFLKFLFFKNIKKKKTREHWTADCLCGPVEPSIFFCEVEPSIQCS